MFQVIILIIGLVLGVFIGPTITKTFSDDPTAIECAKMAETALIDGSTQVVQGSKKVYNNVTDKVKQME